MSNKRSPKTVRKCDFCGVSIDGKPKKTRFCSASCRSKAWRATGIIIAKEHAVYEALVVIDTALYSPEYKDGAIAALQRIHDAIGIVLKKGYQAMLPGIEG